MKIRIRKTIKRENHPTPDVRIPKKKKDCTFEQKCTSIPSESKKDSGISYAHFIPRFNFRHIICEYLDLDNKLLDSNILYDSSILPSFTPAPAISFTWGTLAGNVFISDVEQAYEQMVCWRRNIFLLPSGRFGKDFINEKVRLFSSVQKGDPLERIAFKALALMEHLILQKPFSNSTSKDHVECLKKRMELWKAGNIKKLVDDVSTIQTRLEQNIPKMSQQELSRKFASFIFYGNVHAAIKLLEDHGPTRGVQQLSNEVKAVLQKLHPPAASASKDVLFQGEFTETNPVIFDEITADAIRKAALRTKGAAGVSGGDAAQWKRQMFAFGSASTNLCNAMASFTRRLCTEYIDPLVLEGFIAGRLLAIDKNPGTRPIGIGEVSRRIIGKSITRLLKPDIMEAAGVTQLCAGQESGIEAAIHAITQLFSEDDTDAVLLVDAENAFNSLNRTVALNNIRSICPAFSTVLINIYRSPARLFVTGGFEILSREGVTQGCPLACKCMLLQQFLLLIAYGKFQLFCLHCLQIFMLLLRFMWLPRLGTQMTHKLLGSLSLFLFFGKH
jgi:hypothetical protein